jgi:hypothetical protein
MLVECTACEAFVDGELIADYIDVEEPSGTAGKFSFIKCPRCRPFIMVQVDDGPGSDEPSRLYPPKEMSVSLAIPSSLRSAYDEARACFRVKAYTATAIMCRKTLEGIPDENNIKAHNLASALKEMKEKGIIENRLYEWADASPRFASMLFFALQVGTVSSVCPRGKAPVMHAVGRQDEEQPGNGNRRLAR